MARQCECAPLGEGMPVTLTNLASIYAKGGAKRYGITADEWISRFVVESLSGTDLGLSLMHEVASPLESLLTGKQAFKVVPPTKG